MNSVDFLLTNNVTYEIRTEIKRLGRPIPDLIISKTDNREMNHEILIVVSTRDLNVMGGNQSAWTQEGCVGKGRHKATA
ncbi:hypothetical protein NQ318_009608 [Aromia moschata]|uniref:Uncharacterized protein n=1 Tax=Aromia moschata TaxID=1265417 RepID=A0AAV8XPP4_9CUCU|nr:hypothetical protein NQ318_009608 [Aromia moschata]